ncbi:MAG: (d)CMP kinase [Armatimonadetes bacterium]|nr:(d)CMP kinase [Armatimonadota bacterium]
MNKPIIAIDGPAGAGKSTVARMAADKLGYLYIDTGAMYRAVAYKALQAGTPLSDPAKIAHIARKLDIHFEMIENEQHIFADGEDITLAIRTADATRLSSPVSAIAGVRKRLVDLQRKMAENGGVVMEGRDIGTVVFPDAEVKIFLTASVTARAQRRADQLKEMGMKSDIEQIAADIRERDLRDSSRKHAPLKQAPGASLVETDNMTVEQVVDGIIAIHNKMVAA